MSGFSDRLPGGRKGTGSLKWDGMEVMFGSGTHDAIPMWVADMDFPCPEAVSAAVLQGPVTTSTAIRSRAKGSEGP